MVPADGEYSPILSKSGAKGGQCHLLLSVILFRMMICDSWRMTMSALFLLCIAGPAAPAQTFTSLASFNGTNGRFTELSGLNALLVQGVDGNLYGTAPGGGTGTSCSPSGCGVVFKITTDGVLTVIY